MPRGKPDDDKLTQDELDAAAYRRVKPGQKQCERIFTDANGQQWQCERPQHQPSQSAKQGNHAAFMEPDTLLCLEGKFPYWISTLDVVPVDPTLPSREVTAKIYALIEHSRVLKARLDRMAAYTRDMQYRSKGLSSRVHDLEKAESTLLERIDNDAKKRSNVRANIRDAIIDLVEVNKDLTSPLKLSERVTIERAIKKLNQACK